MGGSRRMRAFTEPLQELEEFQKIQQALKKQSIQVTGCIDAQKAHFIYAAGAAKKKLIVTYSELRAKELCENYRLFDKNVLFYPAKDLIFYSADVQSNLLVQQRIRVLQKLMEEEEVTIVTTMGGIMDHLLPPEVFQKQIETVESDSEFDMELWKKKLTAMGYERVGQVEGSGQFAVRGGILDIFPLTEENPVRIELWGDEIDSIRSFDVESQRSIENLDRIRIYPAGEFIADDGRIKKGLAVLEKEAKRLADQFFQERKTEESARLKAFAEEVKQSLTQWKQMSVLDGLAPYFYDRMVSFAEYFPKEALVVLDEPNRLWEEAQAIEKEFRESMTNRLEKGYVLPGQMNLLCESQMASEKLQKHRCMGLCMLEAAGPQWHFAEHFSIDVRSVNTYNNSFELLVKDLQQWKKKGERVILLCASRTRAKRLAEDLRDHELRAFYSEDDDRIVQRGEIMLLYGSAHRGYEYPLIKFLVISESDIFGKEKKKRKKIRHYEGKTIHSFSELSVGDYVVHENHGLGIYRGIEKIEVDKVTKDYMKVEYAGGSNLYVPATQLDVIQKYADSQAKRPKLNKLGTQEWGRTKTKVRSAVKNIAKDLVQLYAARQREEGFCYGEDTIWQKEFEETFPFDETDDQLEAIEAVKHDMESNKIMDRLICGDVGYGKTEVAIRAAFKAAQESKQVVFLVPTTILAQQHYNNFVQRMKDYPVRVDLLCRFRTAAEQKKTLEDLKKGLVDIVIGTHRVLSKDVQFKDLGLLIIDEEQRFGVTHKEKIKKLRENIDVLTLTATPIPRTLHMSLVGIRDMSVLEEAPMERVPIQTYVMEYNEEMVREAISRELARGGQVYYVYNRVNNIADIAAQIAKLVPEANVAYAHGQMKEHELERIMFDFINGEIDVLVSTTIIETGLDISNVNTMIIHDSDNLGLSQLYQLRGRVGRSNRNAYAFLMYKRDKMLKEVAEKRLAAIKEFTDLGSGFKIAMRDLEIRGAGNLLGMSQHGHMEAVGYDLYCKMLNEAVQNLKGVHTTVDFTTVIDLDVDAYIPAEYIVNETQKLDIYKRIAGIETIKERDEMKDELLDRFGNIPKAVDNLLRIALIRMAAHGLDMTEIKGKNGRITFNFRPDAGIDPLKIPAFLKKHGENLSFTAYGNPFFTYKYKKTELVETDAELLMGKTEELLEEMKSLALEPEAVQKN
mgnify:CR=1 FL=1